MPIGQPGKHYDERQIRNPKSPNYDPKIAIHYDPMPARHVFTHMNLKLLKFFERVQPLEERNLMMKLCCNSGHLFLWDRETMSNGCPFCISTQTLEKPLRTVLECAAGRWKWRSHGQALQSHDAAHSCVHSPILLTGTQHWCLPTQRPWFSPPGTVT